MCINADGTYLPPYVVYKGLNLRNTWTYNGPTDCRFNISESGWMEIPNFLDWFKTLFLPFVDKIEGPKLLIYDGHSSHISVEVCEAAIMHDVHILVLPAHSSHIYQPLDVSVYKSMKSSWKKILDDWYISNNSSVTKEVFPSLFNKVIIDLKRSNAVSGFEATGIYPFDPKKTIKKIKEKQLMSPILNSPSVLPSLRQSNNEDDDDPDDSDSDSEEDKSDEEEADELNNIGHDDGGIEFLMDDDCVTKKSADPNESIIVLSQKPSKSRIVLSNITNITNNSLAPNSALNINLCNIESAIKGAIKSIRSEFDFKPINSSQRVKRSFAESVTETEVIELMKKENAEKRRKQEEKEERKKAIIEKKEKAIQEAKEKADAREKNKLEKQLSEINNLKLKINQIKTKKKEIISEINELNAKTKPKKSEQTKLKILKEKENTQQKKLANLEQKLDLAETALSLKKEILNESIRCFRCNVLGKNL